MGSAVLICSSARPLIVLSSIQYHARGEAWLRIFSVSAEILRAQDGNLLDYCVTVACRIDELARHDFPVGSHRQNLTISPRSAPHSGRAGTREEVRARFH